MAIVENNISSDWDDEDESTQLYQSGMLDDARAALGSLEKVSDGHSEEAPETWFISADGQQKQPLSAGEVVDRCRAGTLSEQTLVWHEGLDHWTRLSDVPELRRILDALARGNLGARNLPPLPSPPTRSAAAASNSFSPQPAPRAPASGVLESDATQVYAHQTATRLKAALMRSEEQGELNEVQERTAQSRRRAYVNRRGRMIALAAAAGVCFVTGAFLFHRGAGGTDPQLTEYNLDATPRRAAIQAEAAAAVPDTSAASKQATAEAAPQPSSAAGPAEARSHSEGATAQQSSRPDNTPALAEMVAATVASRTHSESDQAAPPPRTGSRASVHRDFDEAAARSAMATAAKRARNCRPKGGPRGAGQVSVRIEPSGEVSGATILTSKFEGTVAGSCIRMLFRQASIPAFSGPAKTVVQKFSVPE